MTTELDSANLSTQLEMTNNYGNFWLLIKKLIVSDYLLKEVKIMPLTMAREGETVSIKRVGGKEEIRRHLENLGFVPGANVTVISTNSGNVIVNVKESRVAISKEMANKIMV